MRRLLLCLALVSVAACGRADGLPLLLSQPTAGLVLSTAAGVTVVDAEHDRVRQHVERGVGSGDGRWVFASRLVGAGSLVEAVATDGSRRWSAEVGGDLDVRVVAPDGARVALLPAAYRSDVYAPTGRSVTRLTVLATDGSPPTELRLPGNLEPEAFTTDGTGLFVIEYLPPERPDRYRVRRLDLASGEVAGVHSLDGHLQEAMRGTARVQALADAGDRLYTLYTVDGPVGPRAFVHVLDLSAGWAHCVDLPAGIGSSPEPALAVTALGARGSVVVVDADAGRYVEIDAATLEPSAPADLQTLLDRGDGSVRAVALGDRAFVAGGTQIVVLDPARGTAHRWDAPGLVLDLRADPSGRRLWVATPEAIHALDLAGGRVAASLPAPDLGGAVPEPPVDDGRNAIECAC
jgi:hypothetical protein